MKKLTLVLITGLFLLTACSSTNVKFVNKLEKQTKTEDLNWNTVFEITQDYSTDMFNFILFTNEFHEINPINSYGIVTDDGLSVFFLNESLESGKDGSISMEKNLYIVKGTSDESMKVPVKEKDLEDLEIAIQGYIERKVNGNKEYNGSEDLKFKEINNKSFDVLIKEYLNKD